MIVHIMESECHESKCSRWQILPERAIHRQALARSLPFETLLIGELTSIILIELKKLRFFFLLDIR